MSSRIIPASRIREGSEVPIELADFIDQNQWLMICQAAKNSHSEADITACALECCCCFLFAFPCIFCCHPVCSNSFAENNFKNSLATLNRSLFGGQPVLMLAEQMGVLFNLDYVPRGYTAPTFALVETKVNVVQPVVVNPIQTPLRSMWVTLPEGTKPGMSITVQSPDGIIIQVTVPPDAYPGKQISVEY